MSRLNPQRSIGGEDNLARRIERERTARGWSYEALAKRMTDAGCSIQPSAIYKIEKTNPPRRITVDELVALAQVFDTSIEDLLTPIEVLDQRRAQKLLQALDKADNELVAAAYSVLESYSELQYLAADNPELFDFVKGHHYRRDDTSSEEPGPLFSLLIDGGVVEVDDSLLRDGYLTFYEAIIKQAGEIATARARRARELTPASRVEEGS